MPVQSIPIIFQVSILFDPLIIGKYNLLLASLEPVVFLYAPVHLSPW